MVDCIVKTIRVTVHYLCNMKNAVSNDFFLIGNLVSVLCAIGYYILLNDFLKKI